MTTTKHTIKSIAFATALFIAPTTGATSADAAEHARLQIFFSQGNTAFPDKVEGKHIEEKMRKQGFDIMLSTQSTGLQNGDVITVQSNTLRQMDGKFIDFGVDCSITTKIKPISVAGLCYVHLGEEGVEGTKSTHIVKSPAIESETVWHKVFEDKKGGIAGYVSKGASGLFAH